MENDSDYFKDLDQSHENVPSKLSKNARKKILKRQKYLNFAESRRLIRKQKRNLRPKTRKYRPKELVATSPCKIIIDCSFDDLMNESEIRSLSNQLGYCYSANRNSSKPLHVFVTSFNARLKNRMESELRAVHKSWRLFDFLETPLPLAESNLEDYVYLTADANDVLNELDESKIYIIGGLVDKNRYKNRCLEKAKSFGIRAAALPIAEYLKLSQRKVLTVNHVAEILILYLESRDWEKSISKVIPQRKISHD